MKDLLHKIVQARAGGRVNRMHFTPHRPGYDNASHSWGVAMLMLQLWPEDFPRLAEICLTHDIPEHWTGDSPSPIFRYIPGMKEYFNKLHDRINLFLGLAQEGALPEEDLAKLKACDLLEFYMFCREELNCGNVYMQDQIQDIESRVSAGEILLPDPAKHLFHIMKNYSLVPTWHSFLEEHASELGEIKT